MQALSDTHTFLFEERQRLLDLQAENDELKLQVRPASAHNSNGALLFPDRSTQPTRLNPTLLHRTSDRECSSTLPNPLTLPPLSRPLAWSMANQSSAGPPDLRHMTLCLGLNMHAMFSRRDQYQPLLNPTKCSPLGGPWWRSLRKWRTASVSSTCWPSQSLWSKRSPTRATRRRTRSTCSPRTGRSLP